MWTVFEHYENSDFFVFGTMGSFGGRRANNKTCKAKLQARELFTFVFFFYFLETQQPMSLRKTEGEVHEVPPPNGCQPCCPLSRNFHWLTASCCGIGSCVTKYLVNGKTTVNIPISTVIRAVTQAMITQSTARFQGEKTKMWTNRGIFLRGVSLGPRANWCCIAV